MLHAREGLAFLFAVSLTASALLSLSFSGCGGGEPPPQPVKEAKPPAEYVPGLSADQGEAIGEYGYPDHFFITIDPASSDRVESWVYFSRGKSLDFDDGRLFGEEPVEDESSTYPPTDLRPQDFTGAMTPEEADGLLGEPLYSHEVRDSLMPENTIVVYGKAVLLFRNGRLIGVDTKVRPPQLPPS